MGYVLLALVATLLAVLLLRAALFNPKPQEEAACQPVEFDRDKAVDALAQLVRCRTISYNDPSLEDNAEFEKLIGLLPKLYPNVCNHCQLIELPHRALLFRWPGKSEDAPAVMMSHYDVVPVDEEKWEKPPFDGIIEDGILWGRGTLDTKATFNGVLSAADHLISQGFVPANDIYFAFSGGEEVNGKGAVNIVDYFIENGIEPAIVVDEGGAVVENVFPGVKEPCAMVGIAEKGMINVRYTARSGGGHASAPPPKTPITTLSKACLNIVRHPFKMHITKPAGEMFDTLGRHSTFLFKIIFANLWLFKPVLDLICRLSGGDLNALVRTTTAFTMMEGSNARNVIPPEASVISNMRLNPADTVESAAAYLKNVVNDDAVQIEILESHQPSPISRTDCDGWKRVCQAVSQTWPGCIVTPYLMVQCSDARHYGKLSDKVYRFSAMDMTTEERRSIHGNNERIRLESICKAVEFYIRLMQNC